jgi:CheY-like chemotaxis protein
MPCVLVVEDQPDFRELLQVVLESEGYETMVATNGAVALDLMRNRTPDVVLLDLMMPVMDGWTFRRRQLAEPRFANVPVIAVTAIHDADGIADQLNLPCIRKPIDIDVVLEHVAAACARSSDR